MIVLIRRRRGSVSGSSRLIGPLVLFAAFGVELEQQPEGGEAEQQGLCEPHAACGHVVDALVSVKGSRSQYGPPCTGGNI